MPQARILDSLERERKASGSAFGEGKRSRNLFGVAALSVALLGGVGGVGGFLTFRGHDSVSSDVAATPPVQVAAVPQGDNPSSTEIEVAGFAGTAAPASSAIAFQIEPVAVGAQVERAVSTDSVANAQEQVHTMVGLQPKPDRLAKLAQNDAPASAARVKIPTALSKKKERASSKKVGAAKSHSPTLASAKSSGKRIGSKSVAARRVPRGEEDADTELVAAIIARLDRRGASPTAPAAARPAAAFATQMRRCTSKTDPAEARQCGNRVCEGQWGKVDACPVSRAPTKWRDNEANHPAQRG
jgi:hypothetical protein